MKKFLLPLLVLVFSLASRTLADTIFVANLTGDQETPPVETPAGGLAVLVLNEEMTQLTIVMSAYGFKTPVLFSHVHHGPCGQSGLVELSVTGSDFQNPVIRVWEIPKRLLERLFNGELYVNIHTEAHSGGELRGQVLPIGENCPP